MLVVCKDEVSSGQSGRLAVIYVALVKYIVLNLGGQMAVSYFSVLEYNRTRVIYGEANAFCLSFELQHLFRTSPPQNSALRKIS